MVLGYRVDAHDAVVHFDKARRPTIIAFWQVSDWLDTLWRKASGARVVLVATHADVVEGGRHGDELEWQSALMGKVIDDLSVSLAEKYPYMAPLVIGCNNKYGSGPGGWAVSTTTGEGMTALKKGLVKVATSLPIYGELLPRTWLKVRERVREENMRAKKLLMGRESAGYSVGMRGMAAAEKDGTTNRKEAKQGGKGKVGGGGGRTRGTERGAENGQGAGNGMKDGVDNGGSVGFMWIGHFKRLVKECGVDESQCIPLLRMFHDAGESSSSLPNARVCPYFSPLPVVLLAAGPKASHIKISILNLRL